MFGRRRECVEKRFHAHHSALTAGFSASRSATTEPDEPDPKTIEVVMWFQFCGECLLVDADLLAQLLE
jgi:hypothetical protein